MQFLVIIFVAFFTILPFQKTQSQKKVTDSLKSKIRMLKADSDFKETDTTYIKALYNLARSYLYQDLDSLKILSEEAMRLSNETQFIKGIAGATLGLGYYHINTSDFEKGYLILEDAEDYARQANADTLLLRSINVNAMGHFLQGDYPNAYMLCKKGEELAKEKKNDEMLVFFLMNLGTSFTLLHDYNLALPYYQQALEVVERSNDQEQKAQIQFNLGYLYLHTGNYTKGKEYCKKAIKGFRKSENRAWESSAWAAMGEIELREKKYDKALNLFKKSEALLQMEDKQQIAETYQGFGDTYFHLNEHDKSSEYADMALTLSTEIKFYSGIVKASRLLYEISKKQGKNKHALVHLQKANHISDSIFESDKKIKFLMLEAQNSFEKEQAKIKVQNDKELRKRNFFLFISIFLTVTLGIISLLVYLDVKNKKETNKKLTEINETKNQVFSIIGHDLKSPINTLTELLDLYNKNAITEEEILKIAPKLKENVDYSAFTLNNLLYWSKLQMNNIVVLPSLIAIKQKATQICELFNTQIEKKEIKISCSIAPELQIFVDADHLDCILRNIISNAIKFSRKGSNITFDSHIENENAVISIKDSGVGMDIDIIEAIKAGTILEPALGTQNEKGTGIGLQIAHELIKKNNGNLLIESQKGSGSEFKIYFPLAK